MNLKRLAHGIVHAVAKMGKPLLRLAGVKKGSAADRVAEGAEVVDKYIHEEKPK